MNAEALVAIIAALGGGGFIVQAITAIRSWREGARLKEEEADERLVKRLERRVDELEARIDERDAYIARLVTALGAAGATIPMRAVAGPERG